MQTERAELYFRQGSSDKVYHLQLAKENDQWSVHAPWGRRGSSLQSELKANGVAYEEAKACTTASSGKKRVRERSPFGCPPQKNIPVTPQALHRLRVMN
jgi:predicted DNA-binding WGR domain protein